MRTRVFALCAFLAVTLLWLAVSRTAPFTAVAGGEPQRRRAPASRVRTPPASRPRVDYANFDHATAQHRKACDACHKFPSANWKEVRKPDAAFADITEYPEHASCIGCHRAQFFARERPQPKICSVCHVSATPRHTTRWPFPSLAELFDASPKGRTASSDFGVSFPHDKHEGLFSELDDDARAASLFVRASFAHTKPARARQDDPAQANASCANCHQTFQPQGDSDDEHATPRPKALAEEAFWLKKGTFKTAPRDHSACFTCHSADGGMEPLPSNCAACHKLLPLAERLSLTSAHDDFDPKLAASMGVTDRATLRRWAGRDVGRFRHEWPPHDLACTTCHQTARMNAAEPQARRVPVLSCGGGGSGCHIEPTPDGLLNTVVAQKRADPAFVCTKCHITNGRLPLPESHAAALPAATKK
ncbi:MAG TPA: cytochrome c3 family protein [Pyrinomonadaceae bacterium]|nr:cytochrome c3 family protein [Pyrinomonadaceae bacterium]